MDLIADILLAAGALAAGFYCFVLGRRLKRFNSLEQGVGGAVAVLSSQVDDLSKTLESAQKTAASSAETLSDLTMRAEEMSRKLELQMASLHDLPNPKAEETPITAPPEAEDSPEPMFMRRASGGN
ncbi:MAG: hypothetical protein AAGL89_17095 [Pseudomonadota bacterium]